MSSKYQEIQRAKAISLIKSGNKVFYGAIGGKALILKKEIEPECFLETNFFLAESMVINLIGNAIKHSTAGGIIHIKIDKSYLEISNTGAPLSVQSSKLFERFYKIIKSSDSQGLGLAIVKEICKLNRWEIKYEYEDDLHKFMVKF